MASSKIKYTVAPDIGTVLITNSATNPGDSGEVYDGTSGELIDKKFKPQAITDTTGVTLQSGASAISNFFITLDNNKAYIRMSLTTSAAIAADTVELCRIDLTKYGGNSNNCQETWFLAYSDGGNGFAMMDFVSNGSYGKLQAGKSVCRAKSTSTGIASGSSLQMGFEIPFQIGQQANSFCNRFYGKRTA